MIDPRREETAHRVARRFHDRLALDVERRIDQHGNARQRVELLQQPIEHGIGRLAHGLHARRTVDMHDRRDLVAPFRANRFGHQHER